MRKNLRESLLYLLLAVFLVVGFPLSGYAGNFNDANNHIGIEKSKRDNKGGHAKKHYKDGELIVKYRRHAGQDSHTQLHAAQGSQVIRKFKRHDMDVVKLSPNVSVESAIAKYQQDPDVEYAEPNYIVSIDETVPNDQFFNELWGMRNTGQNGGTAGADIQATDAWDMATGDGTPVVVVIDTGVQADHEDLADNMWVNDAEYNGTTGVDDDGNGYVDDIYGWNAIANNGDPADDHGHGTHCAGTIGATGNNGIGVAGVNWDVQVMACKFLSSSGSGYISDAIECLEYVKTMKDRGVNIVATSNSWGGGGYSQTFHDLLKLHMDDGILFIAAAGNRNSNNDLGSYYPSGYDLPNVLAIAATDRNDQKASFSSYGRHSVDIGAPGVDIVSLRAGTTDMYGDGNHFIPSGDANAKYYRASGTSMATPHVAGLAALIKSHAPSLDWKGVKNLILSGGENIAAMDGITLTGKRINAQGSLTCTDSPVFSALAIPNSIRVGYTNTLSALSINCEAPVGPVTVTTAEGIEIPLYDNGVAPDLAAGDGIFSADWIPTGETGSLTYASITGFEIIPYATSRSSGTVSWVLDDTNRKLSKVDADGVIQKVIDLGTSRWTNVGLAADSEGYVWVALKTGLRKYDSEGGLMFGVDTVDGVAFSNIMAIDVDRNDNGLWVVDNGNRTVVKLDKFGTKVAEAAPATGFNQSYPAQDDPMSVDVNQATGEIWVGARTVLYKFDAQGSEVVKLPAESNPPYPYFNNPRMLAVDQSDGSVWVTNWSTTGSPAQHEVKKVSSSGQILLTLDADSGVGLNGSNTEGIRVDPRNGDVWISQGGSPSLVKLDRNGNPLLATGGLDGLVAFDVDAVTGEIYLVGRYGYSSYLQNALYNLTAEGLERWKTSEVEQTVIPGAVIYRNAPGPYAVVTVPAASVSAWYLDDFYQRLYKVDAEGIVQKLINLGTSQWSGAGLASDSEGYIWLALKTEVRKYDPEGGMLFAVDTVDSVAFSNVMAIDVDRSDDGAWVVDNGNKRVVKLDKYGVKAAEAAPATGFNQAYPYQDDPMSLDVNQTTGELWVGGRSVLYKFDAQGNEVVKLPAESNPPYAYFNNPRMLAVDQSDGSVWVTNWLNTGSPAQHEVKKVSSSGQILLTLDAGSGVGLSGQNTEGVRVDQRNGDVWISQMGDPGLVKLDKNGNPLLLNLPFTSSLVAFDVDSATGDVYLVGRYGYNTLQAAMYDLTEEGLERWKTTDVTQPIYSGTIGRNTSGPYAVVLGK